MERGYRSTDGQHARVVPKGQGGAADAARMIDAIAQIADRRGTELVAMPFGDPSLPALTRAALGTQIGVLMQRGHRDVSDVLGVEPAAQIVRPPLSQIEAASAARAARSGARILLVDGGRIPPPSGLKFSPPPDAPVIAGARDDQRGAPRPDARARHPDVDRGTDPGRARAVPAGSQVRARRARHHLPRDPRHAPSRRGRAVSGTDAGRPRLPPRLREARRRLALAPSDEPDGAGPLDLERPRPRPALAAGRPDVPRGLRGTVRRRRATPSTASSRRCAARTPWRSASATICCCP